MFLLWKVGPWRDPLPNVRYNFSVHIAGMEGCEVIVWLYDDIAEEGGGTKTDGKRKLIRGGGGSIPRISNVTRPHDPGGGKGAWKYPVPQNSMMTRGEVRKNISDYRQGGPVQTPSRGTGRFKREYVQTKQRVRTTAAVGTTPQRGMVCQKSWHKAENQDRCVNPIRLPSAGANMTNPDYTMTLRNPRNTVGGSQSSWNRCDKGMQTPSNWNERDKTTSVAISRGMMTTPAEICVSQSNKAKPSRDYKTAVAAVETDANGTKEEEDQYRDIDGQRTATRAGQMNCDRVAEPVAGPVRPVIPNMNAMNGSDVMHYEWIVRESIRVTEALTANNYLEVPVPQLPRRFLHLAAEARTVEITKDKLCCFGDVQPQGIELPKPVRVTVLMDRPMRCCEPNDQVNRGVSPNITEQPLLFEQSTEEGETAHVDMGNSDANLAGHRKPVDRLSPVNPLNLSEQPALLEPRLDGVGNSPIYHDDYMTFSAGQDEPMNRSRPGSSHNVSDQPVVIELAPKDRGRISMGLVDYDLIVANQKERADRPIRVMPQNECKQLVFPGVKVERVTDTPAHIAVPDDVMLHARSSSDRRAEPDEIHRPVDTERKHAEYDVNGSMAGGLVGQLDNSDPLCPRGVPSKDDSPYPLTLDPVGQPLVTGPPDQHVIELGCGWIDRIQNNPEDSSGILETASRSSSDVSADRLNTGAVGRVATSIGATPSSDSGIHSWKEQWENMSELSSDDASGQPVQPDWSGPERGHTSDIHAPPNTEEEGDSDYPWRDRLVSRISCGSLSDTRREEDGGCSCITVSGVARERYTDIAVLSDFSDEVEEADNTQLTDDRKPEPVQPIVILNDVAPLPVPGEYGRYFAEEFMARAMAEGYRPGWWMVWGDTKIPPKTFKDSVLDLMQEALAKDADAFADSGCDSAVGRFVRMFRLAREFCPDLGCTSSGCECYGLKNRQHNGFLEDITGFE